MCKSGLVAISDTSFFKPKRKVKKKLFCNIRKEIRGKGFFIFFLCKRLQFTLEIDIPFSIGRAVDNLTVLDAFLVFECLFKIICLLYTSPSPRDRSVSRMPSSA